MKMNILGIRDKSGFRFYVTKELREHDAGLIELGLDYSAKNSLPPNSPSFHLKGVCSAECTQKVRPFC